MAETSIKFAQNYDQECVSVLVSSLSVRVGMNVNHARGQHSTGNAGYLIFVLIMRSSWKLRVHPHLPRFVFFSADIRGENKRFLFKTAQDSFNGYRSDFIHMSLSLQSSVSPSSPAPSNLHLTPKSFTHFWAWCGLFNGALSLPTRQGSYYPPRLISPKLGRHLATLKYRIQLPDLYVMHAYIDESRESESRRHTEPK
jgi:hypothetical protein